MKIQVDFYKPSGKWYTGGLVEIENAKLWHGRDFLLNHMWEAQELIQCSPKDRHYWTIVTSDDPATESDRHYSGFFKAVLQVGKPL